MANVLARTVPLMGFAAASGHIGDLAGVKAPAGPLQRWSMELGAEAMESGREEVVDGKPLESRVYLSVDGTGIPMRAEEVEGVAGKRGDVSAGTREAKLAVVYTANGRDRETGAASRDRGSESFSCLIDSGAAPSGGREPSAFAARPAREARHRGLHDAGEPVVVSDGAEWIRGTCDELFGGGNVTFVLDMWHALEHPSDAGRAIHPEGPEWDRRFAETRADIEAGRAAKVVREPGPFSGRTGGVEACCRYFRNSPERMRYNECRDQGIQIESGGVDACCQQFGLRLKRSGTRWPERGANAMLALKCCVMNHRLADLLDWRANQAVAA